MMNATNNKYKTVMCKHFEQNGQCYLGAKCHFAHGPEELRKITDPLPPNRNIGGGESKQGSNYQNYGVSPSVSNYKTMKCRYFEKGHCKFGNSCSFAHGDQDIRSPNSPVPQHVMANMQMNSSMMTPMYDATTQNQINQQQISYLISQMQEYLANDGERSEKLKQANEMNTSGNVQAAASLAYSIIQAPTTNDESIQFQTIMTSMQSYGTYLLQSYQMQNAQAMYGYNPQGLPGAQMMGMTPGIGMNPQFGGAMGMGQSKLYGGHNNYKQNYQGRSTHQSNQANETDQRHDGDSSNINTDMSNLGNMMGNMQISNKPYGGKPKYNNNIKGNRPNQS